MKRQLFNSAAGIAIAAAFFSFGCSTPAANTGNQQSNKANTVANTATTPAPTSTPAAPGNELSSTSTPIDVYKAAHKMRQEKDVEGLKKIFAAEVIEFLTEIGKEEGRSVDDAIREMFSSPQAEKAEVRNEKITGDRATVEYLDRDGSWKTMDFVKEGGAWKISFPDMKLEADGKSANR